MPRPIVMRRKPTTGRFFRFLLLAGLLVSADRAGADGRSVSEQEVVVLATRRPAVAEVLSGEADSARGSARAAGAYPNPEVTYLREQTFGPAGTGEDYISLSQSLDLGGRRWLRGQAGRSRAAAVGLQGEETKLEIAAEARRRFYEVMHRQRRLPALQGWMTRSTAALDVITRRQARGDVAPYHRRRLERERAVAAGRIEEETAALEAAQARLAAYLGLSRDAGPGLAAVGTLLPDGEPPPLGALTARALTRPEVRALEARERAAALERRAAARGRVPELRLEGGWKGVALGAAGRTDGFLAGAALGLPLWDQSRGPALAAAGEARALKGRRALMVQEIEGEVTALRAEAVRLRQAAVRLRADAQAASADLVRIAGAGYQGGELTLLELLDAYRGAVDDELAALDMEHAARRARIALDRTIGEVLP